MNAELCRKALEKVGTPNILINIVSRRVRQLTTGSGDTNRPLIADTATMGAGDIALTEIIEGKLSWETMHEPEREDVVAPRKKRKKS